LEISFCNDDLKINAKQITTMKELICLIAISDKQPCAGSQALPPGQTNGGVLCYCGGKSGTHSQHFHAGKRKGRIKKIMFVFTSLLHNNL
jgi:hypothetical protein